MSVAALSGLAGGQKEAGDAALLVEPARGLSSRRPRVTASIRAGHSVDIRDRKAGRERRAIPARERGLAVLRIDGVGDEARLGAAEIGLVDAIGGDLRDDCVDGRFKPLQRHARGRQGEDVKARVVDRRALIMGAGRDRDLLAPSPVS